MLTMSSNHNNYNDINNTAFNKSYNNMQAMLKIN